MEIMLAIILSQGYKVTFIYDDESGYHHATAERKGRTQSARSTRDGSIESALESLLRYMLSNLALAHDAADYRKTIAEDDD